MKYFAIAMCLIVSACSDFDFYRETPDGCNIIIGHTISETGDRHKYVVITEDRSEEHTIWSSSVFAVGDCLKLTKVEQ